MVDSTDLQILSVVQDNARLTDAEIATRVGIEMSEVSRRIQGLENCGVIDGYHARLNPALLEFEMTAFVFVNVDCREDEAKAVDLLAAIPEVQEIHRIAGEDSYLAKVRVGGSRELERLLRERFEAIGCATRTTVVLKTIKETGALSLRVRAAGKGTI